MSRVAGDEVSFGPFRFDLKRGVLRRGDDLVPLRKKAAEVLRCLVASSGELVSPEALFAAAWPGTTVTPRVLTNVIGELRRVLDEGEGRILNEHGRGYRIVLDDDDPDGLERVSDGISCFVGRESELDRLDKAAATALGGSRQVVFIAGEAGIGKSTLLAAFLERVRRRLPFLVAQAATVQRETEVEPFAPVLDLLEQIGEAYPEVELGELLRREAPTWLLQLPWLVEPEQVQQARAGLRGVGTGRMLREGARLFERLAEQRPVLVVLEDLHWVDSATLDLLATIERRGAAACLLVVGTYRPVQVMAERHALGAIINDLRRRHRLQEIPLAGLTQSAITRYLSARYPRIRLPPVLVPSLEAQTRGNPLFLKAMTDHLADRGYLARHGGRWVANDVDLLALDLPGGVREAVQAELMRLAPATRDVVSVAAVSGLTPSAAEVGAATGLDAVEVERECQKLAEVGYFLRPGATATWPDGESTVTYKFTHPLVRQACLEQVPPLLRRSWHQRVGERLEVAFASHPAEVAGRLVEHFEAAADQARLATYLEIAAATAHGRFAYREATAYLERALAVIQSLPESPARRRREALRQIDFCNMRSVTLNSADLRARAAVDRAYDLAMADGDGFVAFRAQVGRFLTSMMSFRPDYLELAESMVGMTAQHPTLAAAAHLCTSYALGRAAKLVDATWHVEQSLASPAEPGIPVLFEVRRAAFTQLGTLLTLRGELDQGVANMQRAVQRAGEIQSPSDSAIALCLAALVYATQGLCEMARVAAERAVVVSNENDLNVYLSEARGIRAWVALQQGSARGLRDMISNMHASKAHGTYPHNTQLSLWIAEAICRRGDLRAAEPYLEIARRGEDMYQCEVRRVEAGLRHADEGRHGATVKVGGAEDVYREAIEMAAQSGAKLFELRAATDLYKLLHERGRTRDGYRALDAVYASFTEGFDTPHLKEAAALLGR